MALKRSISQRIRQTLKKTKAKLSSLAIDSLATDLNSTSQSLGLTSPASSSGSIQRSPVKKDNATGSEETVEFSLISHAPIYTAAVAAEAGVTAPTSVTPSISNIRKRSGSNVRARNISIHSALPSLDLDVDSFKSMADSSRSYEPNDEVILLPLGPNDTSMGPCTIVPSSSIVPLPLEISNTSSSVNGEPLYNDRPSLTTPFPSLTTSSTISDSQLGSSQGISTMSSLPTKAHSLDPEFNEEIVEAAQANMNPIFIKANQIDHLDKNLDVEQNDLLAEQMALNILQNISEEAVDELSKLKEEISLKIQ